MLDSAIVSAWRTAAQELGVEVVAPYKLQLLDGGTIEVEAFLPDFGGPNGAVAVALEDDRRYELAARTPHFVSGLAESYRTFDRRSFQDTLDDWGWYGASARRPGWYSGKAWA